MRTDVSKHGITLLGGLASGATLMYFFDPSQGRRRRALVRDRVVHWLHAAADALDATRSDVRNRAMGAMAAVRSRAHEEEPTDDVLIGRIRAALGRVVSHPGSIEVAVHRGHVTLTGPILAHEVGALLSCVRAVHGVQDVDNQLDVHETAEHVSGLQGGASRAGERPELLQRNWVPTARLAAGVAGGVLVIYGARKRGVFGTALGLTGAALVARSSTNQEITRLVGLGGGRRAVDLQKTITINAPIEQVFGLFREFENYPEFMTHVREVHDQGNGRTHWVVDGPAGFPVEWDAEVTETVPNERIAWKSIDGSSVEHAGRVRFDSVANGATRVTIQMSYTPPAGVAGHAVATFLGANPKRQMDDDMVRVKTALETGVLPRDAARERSAARG